MTHRDPLEAVPSALRDTLRRRGFTKLTAVQLAVLDPEQAGRDLRISSQTGSGKTVAVGFVIAPLLDREEPPAGVCRPRALVIAPTRELASQVQAELSWLFEDAKRKIVSVTGGTSSRDERRELTRGADVVVGTPGRLLDHLTRGSIIAEDVGAVVLDEADQMLDLGFREDLESILGKLPEARRTHLMSATFSREVQSLAQRYQKNALGVEGTRLGVANTNIAHVIHVVRGDQRLDALVNLLLAAPEEQTLVFVRTRADTGELTRLLVEAGFHAAALSGDMEQEDRTRTITAFRNGVLHVLVATDVAARGIDVPDIGRVIHADPPSDADTYTHRSGRTGRAGKTGVSILLVAPGLRARVQAMVRRAKVEPIFAPVPGAQEILRLGDERLLGSLAADDDASKSPRIGALADRLLADIPADVLVRRLLARLHHTGPTEARTIAAPPPPPAFDPSRASMPDRDPRSGSRHPREREIAASRATREGASAPPTRHAAAGKGSGEVPAASRPTREREDTGGPARIPVKRRAWDPDRAESGAPAASTFVPFRVNWGEKQGADARRLLALVCRRGGIKGTDVGAIQIGPTSSTFEVAAKVASAFAEESKKPDSRDARVRIEPYDARRGGPHRAGGSAPPRRPRGQA